MVVFDTSLREIKIHKNRGSKAIKKVSFKFGEYALITSNESKLELIQFALLKRLLKKLIKKKKNKKKNKDGENKMFLKNYKIWLHILPNFAISKKSKNARMGKGKGNFLR
jgi:ribosomal protein L16/L10AE